MAVDAVLDADSGAVSKTFGALPRMNSLMDLGITTKPPRRKPPPTGSILKTTIASGAVSSIRSRCASINPSPATYELSVFILPLIDNSIYNSVREIVAGEQDGVPLKVPVIEPEPVARLSMNLREEVWVETGGEMLGNFARQVGFDTSLLDFLGPDIHIALADADPIIEMGSGELASAFGPMNGNEMVMIPALVSMFTRPTAVCIGLSDPAAVRRALDNSVGRKSDIFGEARSAGACTKSPAGRVGSIGSASST